MDACLFNRGMLCKSDLLKHFLSLGFDGVGCFLRSHGLAENLLRSAQVDIYQFSRQILVINHLNVRSVGGHFFQLLHKRIGRMHVVAGGLRAGGVGVFLCDFLAG